MTKSESDETLKKFAPTKDETKAALEFFEPANQQALHHLRSTLDPYKEPNVERRRQPAPTLDHLDQALR